MPLKFSPKFNTARVALSFSKYEKALKNKKSFKYLQQFSKPTSVPSLFKRQDIQSISLYILIGAIICYINLFHNQVWNSYVDPDAAYHYSIIFNYISKLPEVPLNLGFTRFAIFTAFHKFTFFHTVFILPEFRWSSFFGNMKYIIAFQLIGFVIPRNLIMKLYTYKPVNTALDMLNTISNTSFILNALRFTVLANPTSRKTLIFPNNAYADFLFLILLLGMGGGTINKIDMGIRVGWKQMISRIGKSYIMIWTYWGMAAVGTHYIYMNYQYFEEIFKSLGFNQYDYMQSKETGFQTIVVLWWVLQSIIMHIISKLYT